MKSERLFVLYNTRDELPAVVLDTWVEVEQYLHRPLASIRTGFTRFKQGKIDYIRDDKGNTYYPYIIEGDEK